MQTFTVTVDDDETQVTYMGQPLTVGLAICVQYGYEFMVQDPENAGQPMANPDPPQAFAARIMSNFCIDIWKAVAMRLALDEARQQVESDASDIVITVEPGE